MATQKRIQRLLPQQDDPLAELARRQQKERQKQYAASPKKMSEVLPTLMAKRGYARIRSGADLQAAWRAAAGDVWSAFTQAGQVQRGVLQVMVGNSTVLQELTFAQPDLLAKMQQLAPDAGIKQLRFRTGKIS